MGDVSIYNTIRSSKVSTGLAPNFWSMRKFDEDATVCPARANVSDYGVAGVARDSINTETEGCFSPLDRMEIENLQRPRYSVYLNASAIYTPGVGDEDLVVPDDEYQSKPSYDTQLGNQFVRPVLPREQMNPTYSLSKFRSIGGDATQQEKEEQKISCFMNRTYENRQCDTNS
jgi:hypothetical protein